MTITKCPNCNCKINTDITFIRCCDAYVCSRICANERYKYIESVDPHMRYSHSWQYKKLKTNQYGASPISRRKKNFDEHDTPPTSGEINHSITDIQFSYDSDSDVENTLYHKNTNIILSLFTYCTINIIKTIITNP